MTEEGFFHSDNVQEEISGIFKTYQKLAHMQNKLSGMNKEQRLEHIENTKSLIEKKNCSILDLLLLLWKTLRHQTLRHVLI
ncbi:hypothetical protein Syn7803C57_216 [Synechococcus phage ACG-2014d]|uniref:Uncharacterized protein n=1 Tax=Synechococcus phage ACG-2014d TaxID=1493509 RepID=A0A0E3EQ66_9CAUD|nr:hypothetical protein Syn7803C57_216 [Synechococcus phage ACG-2014d]